MIRKIKALGLASSLAFAFVLAMSALVAPAAQAAPTHPELPDLSHGGFNDPCGAATDSEGNLYVASVSSIVNTTTTKEQG